MKIRLIDAFVTIICQSFKVYLLRKLLTFAKKWFQFCPLRGWVDFSDPFLLTLNSINASKNRLEGSSAKKLSNAAQFVLALQ